MNGKNPYGFQPTWKLQELVGYELECLFSGNNVVHLESNDVAELRQEVDLLRLEGYRICSTTYIKDIERRLQVVEEKVTRHNGSNAVGSQQQQGKTLSNKGFVPDTTISLCFGGAFCASQEDAILTNDKENNLETPERVPHDRSTDDRCEEKIVGIQLQSFKERISILKKQNIALENEIQRTRNELRCREGRMQQAEDNSIRFEEQIKHFQEENKSLQQQLGDSEIMMSQYEERIAVHERATVELNTTLNSIEQREMVLATEVTALKHANSTLEEKLTNVLHQNCMLEKEVLQGKQRIEVLSSNLHECEHQLAETIKKLTDAEVDLTGICDLQEEVRRKEDVLSTLGENILQKNDQIRDLADRLRTAEEQSTISNCKLVEYQQQTAKLSDENDELQRTKSELVKELSIVQDGLTRSRDHNCLLQQQASSLEDRCRTLEENLKSVEEDNVQHMSELKETKSTLQTVSTELNETTERIRRLGEDLESTKKNNEHLVADLNELRDTNQAVCVDANNMTEHNNDLRARLESMQQQVSLLEEQLLEGSNTAIRLSAELDEVTNSRTKISHEADEIMQRNVDQEKSLRELEMHNSSLRQEIASLKAENVDLTATIERVNESKNDLRCSLHRENNRVQDYEVKIALMTEDSTNLSAKLASALQRVEELENVHVDPVKYRRASTEKGARRLTADKNHEGKQLDNSRKSKSHKKSRPSVTGTPQSLSEFPTATTLDSNKVDERSDSSSIQIVVEVEDYANEDAASAKPETRSRRKAKTGTQRKNEKTTDKTGKQKRNSVEVSSAMVRRSARRKAAIQAE